MTDPLVELLWDLEDSGYPAFEWAVKYGSPEVFAALWVGCQVPWALLGICARTLDRVSLVRVLHDLLFDEHCRRPSSDPRVAMWLAQVAAWPTSVLPQRDSDVPYNNITASVAALHEITRATTTQEIIVYVDTVSSWMWRYATHISDAIRAVVPAPTLAAVLGTP